ncbi:amino acid adenylation domain-containing protein [Methylobacterium sp. 1030]|uniref:non-ribosomal peptide synthetase n=1 Tax=Methylobacterium sp. 1030 TaxID=3156404 RepID=UPI00339782BF
MTVPALIDELDARGAFLALRGDALLLQGETAALPGDLVARIAGHKPEIREYLADLRAAPATQAAGGGLFSVYLPSHGQERLAFLETLYPDSAAYIVAASVFFRGDLDIGRLTRALVDVVGRHEAVRTYLARRGERSFAVTDHEMVIDLPFFDLSGQGNAAAILARWRSEIATTPFSLERPPLMRWKLVRHGPGLHELMVAIHHFISDGWSLVHAFREGAQAYGANLSAARREGYRRFARYQRQRARHADRDAAVAAAKASLEGCDLAIRPFGRPREVVRSDRGGRSTFTVDRSVAPRLRTIAAANAITIGTLLSAAFAAILHRHSGAPKFVLGVALSDRPSVEFESTFGFFVNWLPVPVECRPGEDFLSFASRFHAAKLAAIERGHVPFDEIVRTMDVGRQMFLHPLFQYMCVSHVPARRVAIRGLDLSIQPIPNGGAKLDLTVFLTDTRDALAVEGEGDLFLEFEFNRDLFDDALIDGLVVEYQALLRAVADDPAARVRDAEPVPPAGRMIEHPHAGSILEPFLGRCEKTPDAVAVRFGDADVGYAALRDRALAVAAALAGAGVVSGDRVCVLQERSPDLIAALLGCFFAGAVFTPLDSDFPGERLRTIVAAAGPAAILCSARFLPAARDLDADARVVDLSIVPQTGTFDARSAVGGDSPAYLLFTSGSTGTPKGVVIGHGGLANFTGWLGRYLATTQADRVLCKTPFAFDAFVRETVAPLCTGATIVMVSDEEALDMPALLNAIEANDVTVLHATPTIYRAMLAEAGAARKLRSLVHVMCGGEVLDAALATRHAERNRQSRLHNVYGPTECTVDVTAFEVPPGGGDPACLGAPIANTRIVIVDESLAPLPAGAVGEIVIVGAAVGLGYWRNEAEDKRRFIDAAPFGASGRAYRTGDLGQFGPDGLLRFHGRIDRQVKIRGARVELDEIESVLKRHPAVRDAAVIVHAAKAGEGALFALAVVESGAAGVEQGLRDALGAALPIYMMPRAFVLVPDLPRLTSGKIDRRRLADLMPVADADPQQQVDVADWSAEEREILGFVRALLEREDVSIHDSFFDLGGHSLNAVRLLARVNKRFGVSLSVRDLFDNPTVAGLAARLLRPDALAAPNEIKKLRRPRVG